MDYIDLHVHSNASDGTFTPTELVEYAKLKNLKAFALTDHDTIKGLREAEEAASSLSIEVIPGIEFSTDYNNRDIHILGLDFDRNNLQFLKYLSEFVELRDYRNKKMAENLRKIGISISVEELQAKYSNSVITRAHFASFLYEKGYVSTRKEAFDVYVGDHTPYFVPRDKVSPNKAVSIIREANGIPVLAHPILYHMPANELDALTSSLKDSGLMAIEAVYSTYGPYEEQSMRKLAKKYNLQISGGSDFHGGNKPDIDLGVGKGNLKIPYQMLLNLRDHNKHE